MQAALSSHPDKVAAEDRASAEIRFKSIGKAYEILSDDSKRHLYDTHGMSAFEGPQGASSGMGPDLEEMLSQMFGMGMGMGGRVPPGFERGGPRRPQRSEDEEQAYQVTLEEIYKGKTTKFTSKKNVICGHCKGTGGKDKAKPKQCASCQGKGIPSIEVRITESTANGATGMKKGVRSIGPNTFTHETVICSPCKGTGKVFKEKERCKKCKGERVVESHKLLELYIPRGSRWELFRHK